MTGHRFSTLFFSAAALFFAALAVRSAINYETFTVHFRAFIVGFVIPGSGLAGSLLALKVSPKTRANLALTLFSILVPLYGIEIYLTVIEKSTGNEDIAREMAIKGGRPFDKRSFLEVFNDMRSQGVEVYPPRTNDLKITDDNLGLLQVFGGISNATTLLCKESGQYGVYESDEHGFKNPRGIWSSPHISVAVVGDSFAQGTCVKMESDIVGVIRKTYPNSINLGARGTGPLSHHAIISEYMSDLKPKHVVWIWYEGNDGYDMSREKTEPLLNRYLGGIKKVGLINKQNEIDKAFKILLNDRIGAEKMVVNNLSSVARLSMTRKMLGLSAVGSYKPEIMRYLRILFSKNVDAKSLDPIDQDLLAKLARRTKQLVESWGGRLYFAYLPTWTHFCRQADDWKKYCVETGGYDRANILRTIKDAGITAIDMLEVFKKHENPGALFYFPGSHNSEAGYRLIGETIAARIRETDR